MVTKKYGSISDLICSTLRSFEKNDQLLSGSFIKNFPIRLHGTVVGDPSSITLQVFPPKLFILILIKKKYIGFANLLQYSNILIALECQN